ncbi:hypothetical protein ACN263_13585 [Micromonospora sp. WMMD729]|uniref:hypothetical protein n=1 Tax=Micromonospora sp. WMMD729 TaxID=3404127 RepID=UPI003BF58257
MGFVDVVLAAAVAVANLAVAAMLLARSRGGATTPRIFGRAQPVPRLRAVMHACLGLGLGVGWLVKDVFPAGSTADAVVYDVTRVLLAGVLVAAVLVAVKHPRPTRDRVARS